LELKTSHQLLKHYLDGLEEWLAGEYWTRAKEIRATARAEGRAMTPSEAEEAIAFDRRALRLYLEATFADHVKSLERQVEESITNGKAPPIQISKMLKINAAIQGGRRAEQAAQRARALLQKYFSPEGQAAVRERLRKMPRPARAVLSRAQRRELFLRKVLERFDEIGGALLLDEGEVRYFVPNQSALSQALVAHLVDYHDEVKRLLEANAGRVDFAKVKAVICQRFQGVSLSPLEPHSESRRGAGNSSRNDGEEERHAVDIQTGLS
jgi:hypothetical protein